MRRFAFLPLTEDEIEKLESIPRSAPDHLSSCSCGGNGGSGRVLEELADLLLIALAHGHQLTIEPNADDYALNIDIGTSALAAKKALGAEELRAIESAPYDAKHPAPCEVCRCAPALPIATLMTLAAIALNHGHAVRLQPDSEGPDVSVTIASERHEAFDRPSGPVPLDSSAIQRAMQQVR